jgi:hypothetical protein
VTVTDEVVKPDGRVEQSSSMPVIERVCRSVDGTVSVDQSLGHTHDGLAGPRPGARSWPPVSCRSAQGRKEPIRFSRIPIVRCTAASRFSASW